MILQPESGLSIDAYNALQAQYGDVNFQLLLEQFAPSWEVHTAASIPTDYNFEVVNVSPDILLRAYLLPSGTDIQTQTLASEDGGDQVWTDLTELTCADMGGVPFSMVASGTEVRVFWYDSASGHIHYYWADAAAFIGWWTDVDTGIALPGTPKFIASAHPERVHFVYITPAILVDKGGSNWRLGCLEKVGPWWNLHTSDVYWPFLMESFDVVSIGGAFDSEEIIACATDLPPILSYEAIGTKVLKKTERVTGIVTFRYWFAARWSDHYVFDVVDQPNAMTRTQVKLSTCGDYYILSYLRVDTERGGYGTANRDRLDMEYHTRVAVSRSKTGLDWECPVTVFSANTGPAIMVARGKHLYLCLGTLKTLRSPMVAYAGTPDTSVVEDVTDYALAVRSRIEQIRNTGVTLANPDRVLQGPTKLLYPEAYASQARLLLGYHTTEGLARTQVLVGDVVQMARDKRLPVDHLPITIQDRLGLLNLIAADNALEWQSVTVGADDFRDPTDTGYGGMRHIAPQRGAFKNGTDNTDEVPAQSDQEHRLYSASDWKQAIGWSTFVDHAFCGEISAGEVLTGANDEYIGLVFNAVDRNNLWAVIYLKDEDEIWVVNRSGLSAISDPYLDDDSQYTDDDTIQSVAAMGWTATDKHYLKAVWRYNLLRVYTSLDGVVWSPVEFEWTGGGPTVYDVELPGVGNTLFDDITTMPKVAGYAGLIAYGASDAGSQPPPSDGEPWVPPPPPVVPVGKPIAVLTVGVEDQTGGVHVCVDVKPAYEGGVAVGGFNPAVVDITSYWFYKNTMGGILPVLETGDTNNNLSNWLITGVTPAFSTDPGFPATPDRTYQLYWDLIRVGGLGGTVTVDLYKEVGKTTLVATGSLLAGELNGTIALAAVGGSGISGNVVVAYTADDTDANNKLTFALNLNNMASVLVYNLALSGPLLYDPVGLPDFEGRGAWLLVGAGESNKSRIYYNKAVLPPAGWVPTDGDWESADSKWELVYQVADSDHWITSILPLYNSGAGAAMVLVDNLTGHKIGKVYAIGRTFIPEGSQALLDTYGDLPIDGDITWAVADPLDQTHIYYGYTHGGDGYTSLRSSAGVDAPVSSWALTNPHLVTSSVIDYEYCNGDPFYTARFGTIGMVLIDSACPQKFSEWKAQIAGPPLEVFYYFGVIPVGVSNAYCCQGLSFNVAHDAALTFGYNDYEDKFIYLLRSTDRFKSYLTESGDVHAVQTLTFSGVGDKSFYNSQITQKIVAGVTNLVLLSVHDGDTNVYQLAVSANGGSTFYWAGLERPGRIQWIMETDFA